MTIRVGITGLGNSTDIHVPTVQQLEGATLTAVCDLDPATFENIAGPETYTDHEAMLGAEDLDLVLVCTPPSVRIPLVEAAGRHGVAVLVEKPTTTTVEELEELIRIRDEYGIPASATRNVAYFPIMQRLGQRVASGAVGSVTAVEFTWAERRPLDGSDLGQASWVRDFETGVIAEMICHPVYCALSLTDRLAEDISVIRRSVSGDRTDGVSVQAVDVDGALVSVSVLTRSNEMRHLRVHGTQGTADVRLTQQTMSIDHQDGPTVTRTEYPDPSPQSWLRGHYHLLDEYVSLLAAGGSLVPVPLERDRDVIRVFEAVESG